ncbi:MAG: DUF2607 family protein [Arenicella sp.]|nr:DUF2607 family protein [Arenicella sp.]
MYSRTCHAKNVHRWISAALLAFMLVAQSASAAHSLDHQGVDHTEICQVFKTADHTFAIEIAGSELDVHHIDTEQSSCSTSAVYSRTVQHHSARAPPHH